jgi:hypothetical protein
MEGITIVSLRIVGISPVLMNNPAGMAPKPQGVNTKQIPSAEDEAATKVYRMENGQLYLPSTMFRSALIGAGAGRRIGKMGAGTILSGSVFTVTDKVPLVDPTTGKPITKYAISTMRAVVNKSGVLRSRPEIAEWACNIDLEVDVTQIPNLNNVVELMNIAGRMRGVGDFRPQKKGPYGRFRAETVDNAVKARRKAG